MIRVVKIIWYLPRMILYVPSLCWNLYIIRTIKEETKIMRESIEGLSYSRRSLASLYNSGVVKGDHFVKVLDREITKGERAININEHFILSIRCKIIEIKTNSKLYLLLN